MDDYSINDNPSLVDLPTLFTETLGWDRRARPLAVTTAVLGVASPTALDFCLTGIAQKRGAQVYLCPPDDYGRVPNQTTRRLIQSQVALTAYHNIVIYTDAARKTQVWQWAEREIGGRLVRLYEHASSTKAQAADLLVRLASITFTLKDEEAGLTLVEVVRRLKTAFADGHAPLQRGGHGRPGLRVYDQAEMDEGIRFWWERILREPYLTRGREYPWPVPCGAATRRRSISWFGPTCT